MTDQYNGFFNIYNTNYKQLNQTIVANVIKEINKYVEDLPSSLIPKKQNQANEDMGLDDTVQEFKEELKTVTNLFRENKLDLFYEVMEDYKLNHTLRHIIFELFFRNKIIIGFYENELYQEVKDKNPSYFELREFLSAKALEYNQILVEIYGDVKTIIIDSVNATLDQFADDMKMKISESELNKKLDFVSSSGKYDSKVISDLSSLLGRGEVDESLVVNGVLDLLSWMSSRRLLII